MSIRCSLVIPCYNERKNLEALRDNILALPAMIEGEVILVDNGSSDSTGSYIAELAAINNRVVLVTVEKNIGYGYGILAGLKKARGQYIGWTHADGQSNYFDAVTGFSILWTKPNPENYFVMGARQGRSFYDQIFAVGMSMIETVLFGTVLNDIPAQPKIMSRRFFDSLTNPPHDFSLDLYVYLMAKRQKLKVYKFNVEFGRRFHGVSSWNRGFVSRLNLIKRTLWGGPRELDRNWANLRESPAG